MTEKEFRALLRESREAAAWEYVAALVEAHGGGRGGLIGALAALASAEGAPRLELGDDEDLVAGYVGLAGGDPWLDDRGDGT